MTTTIIYTSSAKWRFGVALAAAVVLHLAALFANGRKVDAAFTPGFRAEPPEIVLVADQPQPDPLVDPIDPLPMPPNFDPSYIEDQPTPPPVHARVARQVTPIVKPRSITSQGSLKISSAKVFALSAPRPEYPFEARRQKITGDGMVVMNVDSGSGTVTSVTMTKSTGNAILDNAATAGFHRWRFKPGTVASVTCPVTFTLTGASY
jgi:TonB family protein